MIHRAMQAAGAGATAGSTTCACLVARQDVTGADRQWAEQYEPGDVVRYTQRQPDASVSRPASMCASRTSTPAHNLVTVSARERRARHLRSASAAGRHALSRGRPGVRDGRPRAVDRAGSRAADRES